MPANGVTNNSACAGRGDTRTRAIATRNLMRRA
jgi:hypothetical protein